MPWGKLFPIFFFKPAWYFRWMSSPLCGMGSSESSCLLHVISSTQDFIAFHSGHLLETCQSPCDRLVPRKTVCPSHCFLRAGVRLLQVDKQGFALCSQGCHPTPLPFQLQLAWNHLSLGCIQLEQHISFRSGTRNLSGSQGNGGWSPLQKSILLPCFPLQAGRQQLTTWASKQKGKQKLNRG